ncbi:hypothetical protein J2Y48_004561 [Mycoplana sp. BE70]|uniref:hypothetical protein n=1 Tax=Mycoplana sp. BE70 TaxID=2817775 RepID=UPI0028624EE6|nr:hypothetical protein [Mycoplana sp. BE70]MDR6759245.1 hypothetical protein [Mycoplana sp. BE70]
MLLRSKAGRGAAVTGSGVRGFGKVISLLLMAGMVSYASPAAALDSQEAERVVTILENLVTETGGSVFYDEEAAEEWFQIDDETSRLIPAAGFTRTAWKTAFDQTMTGFIASIPQAEMEQMMEDFMDKIGEVAKMTPQQKEEAMALLRAEKRNFDGIRARGAEYREFVSSYIPRLRNITFRR